jgi:hypothetical protein
MSRFVMVTTHLSKIQFALKINTNLVEYRLNVQFTFSVGINY